MKKATNDPKRSVQLLNGKRTCQLDKFNFFACSSVLRMGGQKYAQTHSDLSYRLCIVGEFSNCKRVVGISDGDTVTVLHEKQPVKVRLNAIDCPEKNQAFGRKAKQFTSSLCFGKQVDVNEHGRDRYGRTIGEVKLADGRDLNHELVRAGMAWWYQKYAPKDVLDKLEETARKEKRGLWADPEPLAPWEFRHKRKR